MKHPCCVFYFFVCLFFLYVLESDTANLRSKQKELGVTCVPKETCQLQESQLIDCVLTLKDKLYG